VLRRRLATATGSVVIVAVVAACGGGGAGDDAGARSGRFAGVHERVCVALAAAVDGDLDEARATFDDVHVGLHALATAAGERDRAVAARLLEAKQAAEAEVDEDSLAGLVAPVAEAVRATGGTAPDSCP
jgi:hypothetical protein